MSRRFEPSELPAAIGARGSAAFLVSVGEARPHIVSVAVTVDEGPRLRVGVGRRTVENIARTPQVTLLWPAPPGDGWSLLVDGHAEVDGRAEVDTDGTTITIDPSGGVLHTTEPAGPDRRC